MNKIEESVGEMQAKAEAFLIKNKDRFVGFGRLNTEISTFIGLRLILAPIVAKQAEVITGITKNKTVAFVDLGNRMVKASTKAFIWANDTNDQALAAVFNISTSSFTYQSKTKQLIQAQGIQDALLANGPALIAYNVTADDISAIANGIVACQDHSIAPGAASNSRKAATMAIKKINTSINASLIIIDGLIASEYAESDPDFVNEYHNNRKVEGKGVRHTGISATFTDAATGKVIEHATVEISTLGKTAISNINGIAEIAKMRTGTYHVNFSATGYTLQMHDVMVPRGRRIDVAIALVVAVAV